MRSIFSFSIFAILVSAVPAFSLDFSTAILSEGTITVSRMEGFRYKTQGGNSLEIASFLEWESFAFSGILGAHGTEASNLRGGWGYRGYEGVHLRLQVEAPLFTRGLSGSAIPDGSSRVRAGLGGGGGGYYSRYRKTDQVHFYPAVYTFLFLDAPTGSPKVRIRYALPFEWYFRRDLDTSFSIGLSIGVLYTWTNQGKGDI